MSSRFRLILACALFSSWMVLLMTGVVLGGALHLLLVASLVLFFWVSPSKLDDVSTDPRQNRD